MKTKSIASKWLYREGLRLDSKPYMSGAIEAQDILESLDNVKPLKELTRGHKGGIYNGPKFSRIWVKSPEHGVPFLGSSTMLMADLSDLPLLRKKDALSTKLSYLCLKEGTTLISCSGTIGRTVYARKDMENMWTSQHIIKVVPDEKKIKSGYLYAYLSSKFGVPLIVSGTYGAIIQHIEPRHIEDLLVPCFDSEFESKVDLLVVQASELRISANIKLKEAIQTTLESWHVDLDSRQSISNHFHPDIQVLDSSEIGHDLRFDAFFYGSSAKKSDALLKSIGKHTSVLTVGDVARDVFETPRFGRVSVEDPDHGVPFFSISDLVRFDPRTEALISRKQAQSMNAYVSSGWLILPRVGQINGVFGTVCFVPKHLDGVAVSDNNIRIAIDDPEDGAYLWAALSTDICYQQIIRRACGTSIPYLDAGRVSSIPVPWPSQESRGRIAKLVNDAMEFRSKACLLEQQATDLIDWKIKETA